MTQSMKLLSLIPAQTLALTSLALMLSACLGSGGGGSTAAPLDAINITNISPASGVAGTSTTYAVDVSYTLASKPAGLLMIGFNTSVVGSFNMISAQDFAVGQGSGTHTFTVTTIPQDWAPNGTFQAYVNLSENPHPPTWTPLATDYAPISIAASAVAGVSASPASLMPCSGAVCL